MAIRVSAKAVIIQDGKILLQCCRDDEFRQDYFELPGGGQLPQETMEQAVVRECLEETGYHVEVLRFFAVSEEIITIESVRRDYPDYAHRIFHMFLCRIRALPPRPLVELDRHQIDVRWFPLEEIPNLRLRPTNLRSTLSPLLESGGYGYLGTSILDTFDI